MTGRAERGHAAVGVRHWDPDNVFGRGHNIPPATGQDMPAAPDPLAARR